MKLSDSREYYQYFTQETSKISRNLALVGFGVIWVFKGVDSANRVGFSKDLTISSFFLVVMMICDMMHYVYGSIAWGIFNRIKENDSLNEKKDFNAPRSINWLTNVFFWLKVFFLFIAYFYLLKFLGYNTFIYQ